MTTHYHAIVWIDHREARVFQFDRDGVDNLVIRPENPTRQVHHKANSVGSGHAAEDPDFLAQVMAAIADSKAILIVGPAGAKTSLFNYIHRHQPALAECVVAVESIDHPSDKALVAHARSYFKADHQKEERSSGSRDATETPATPGSTGS